MYYALTINADQIITGVHESVAPILTDTFAANPGLVDDTVIIIPAPADYQTHTHILCYDEDGTRKPDLWCIENGYMELPPNKEIIDGELVDKEIPAEEQPQTLKQYLEEQFGAVRQETAPTQKAARVMFQALAQNDTITEADALDNKEMFDQWSDFAGKTAPAGILLQYDDGLFRVQQEHLVQEHYPPSVHTAALYTRVQPPNAGPEPWQSGQSYAKDVEVIHNGGVWLSGVDNNVWGPGAPGVYDNVWKRVRDA